MANIYKKKLINTNPNTGTVAKNKIGSAVEAPAAGAYTQNLAIPTTNTVGTAAVNNNAANNTGLYGNNLQGQGAPQVGVSPVIGGGGTTSDSDNGQIQSYTDYIKNQKNIVAEKYDSDINYAEQTRNESYTSADDAYKTAIRDANANLKLNQPTYGLAAEQLYRSGLTGGGYSDYLAGKAYEQRTAEANAARSQMNYAKLLADQNYRDAIAEAENNKYNNQMAVNDLEGQYVLELENEYKAKRDDVINAIMSGIYGANIAETLLKDYSVNGIINDETRYMLQEAQANYDKSARNEVTSAFLQYITQALAAGIGVTEASARQYLIDSVPGIDEATIKAYMDGYFKDGKLNKDAVAGQLTLLGTGTGSTNNSPSTSNPNSTPNTDVNTPNNNVNTPNNDVNTPNTGVNTPDKDNSDEVNNLTRQYLRYLNNGGEGKTDADLLQNYMNRLNIADEVKAAEKELKAEIRALPMGEVFLAQYQKDPAKWQEIVNKKYEENKQKEEEKKKAQEKIEETFKKLEDAFGDLSDGIKDNIADSKETTSEPSKFTPEMIDKVLAAANTLSNTQVKNETSKIPQEAIDKVLEVGNEIISPKFDDNLKSPSSSTLKEQSQEKIQAAENEIQKVYDSYSALRKLYYKSHPEEWEAIKDDIYKKYGVTNFVRQSSSDNNYGGSAGAGGQFYSVKNSMVRPMSANLDVKKNNGEGSQGYSASGNTVNNSNVASSEPINVNVNGKKYVTEILGEVTNKAVMRAADAEGIEDGEIFTYGRSAYLMRSGRLYEINPSFLSKIK